MLTIFFSTKLPIFRPTSDQSLQAPIHHLVMIQNVESMARYAVLSHLNIVKMLRNIGHLCLEVQVDTWLLTVLMVQLCRIYLNSIVYWFIVFFLLLHYLNFHINLLSRHFCTRQFIYLYNLSLRWWTSKWHNIICSGIANFCLGS